MKRVTKIEPGHDCMFAPCAHEKKGDHGIHGDEWHYQVSDGLAGIRLVIYTDNFPSTVPAAHVEQCRTHHTGRPKTMLERRSAADLSLHVGYPTERDSLRQAWKGSPCDLLIGGVCDVPYSSSLGADTFWDAHGEPAQLEQREAFWLALEARLVDLVAANPRVDTEWKRCNACDGKGTVAVH